MLFPTSFSRLAGLIHSLGFALLTCAAPTSSSVATELVERVTTSSTSKLVFAHFLVSRGSIVANQAA